MQLHGLKGMVQFGGAYLYFAEWHQMDWGRRLGGVQCITKTPRMTNRLFLLSGYCFRLSYLLLLRRLCDLTTGVSDVAEGPDCSVHFEIFFLNLSRMPGWCIHLQTAELSHKSAASGCIDLVYGYFKSMGLYCNFRCSFGAVLKLPLNWPPSCCLEY